MDDMQRIYHVVNEDDVKFVIKNTINFANCHNRMMKEIHALRENDWSHVHITQRTLSFGNNTYNLNSELVIGITVPKSLFGDVKTDNFVDEISDSESELEEINTADEGTDDWSI